MPPNISRVERKIPGRITRGFA